MTHFKTATIVLIIALLISLVFTYASMLTIVQNAKDNTERVLDSFVIEGATGIYSSIKNGNSYITSINSDYFVYRFFTDRTLDFDSTYLYNKNSKGETLFKLTIPQTTFTVNNTLNLTCTYDLFIPMHFAGKQVMELRIPIQIKTSYTLK